MNITSIKVTPVHNDLKLKAYVSIVIDSCFAVHDLKIIQKDDKIFVAMPNKRSRKKNIFRDIAHPIDAQTRKQLEDLVFDEYEKMMESSAEYEIPPKASSS